MKVKTIVTTLTPILSGLTLIVALAWLTPILSGPARAQQGAGLSAAGGPDSVGVKLAPNSDSGLVGHWPFDEGAGTNTVDVSGYERAGTLQGDPLPIWTSGVTSNALRFDGLQNRVEVPHDPAACPESFSGLSPTNALTLATWVKAATNITSEAVAKWTTNELGGYMLSLTNGRPSLELTLNGVYTHSVGTRGLADTNWHHLAGTYNGAQMAVYLDGETDGSVAATGAIDVVTVPLLVGLLEGELDDVRIYDRALSAAEIAALYNMDTDGGGVPDMLSAKVACRPPSIRSQPVDQTKCQGQPANFKVAASGSSPLNYQWRKNGVNLNNGGTVSGATSRKLALRSVTTNAAGSYSVLISNKCGSVTSASAMLTVAMPPSITSQPTSQTVCAGQTANFSVTSSGASKYQWRKNGKKLSNRGNVSGATSPTLTLSNVAAGDAVSSASGFDCVVSGACGSPVTSSRVGLTVNAIPSAPTASNNSPICAGGTLNLTASTVAGATYSWTGPNGFTSSLQNPSIANATTAASGTYTVTVTVGSCGSAPATTTATVNSAPSITASPTNQTVCAGQTAGFTAAATGSPTPTVQWQCSTNGGATFTNISGATITTLTFAAGASDNGTEYRAVFSNIYPAGVGACGTISSPPATLTINSADSVGDGISDCWRQYYFGGSGTTTNSSSCASCDPDKDGYTNLQEYNSGTDPLDANSNPATVVAPTFSPEGGMYLTVQSVTISCATAGATIHYTINGLAPTESDTVITSGGAVTVSAPTLLRVRAFKGGMTPSETKSGLYQIGARVAAGWDYSFALETNGTLWAWGYNADGELGDGTTVSRSFPELVSLPAVAEVAGGYYHTVAADTNGTVWTWGSNSGWGRDWMYFGQLGDGTYTNHSSPLAISGVSKVVAVAAGSWHTMALRSDGTVWTWGNNGEGELGIGLSGGLTNWPVQAVGLTQIIGIAAGSWHSVALRSDGTVWAWGYNADGELGDGTWTHQSAAPERLGEVFDVVAVAAGAYYTMALRADGTVWTWGDNIFGQLGRDCDNNTVPGQVNGLSNVVAIAAGQYHTLAVTATGQVYSWGWNYFGQLGLGNNDDQTTPQLVSALTNVVLVCAAGNHSMAVESDGTIWSWGANDYGQLGQCTTQDTNTPGRVGLSVNSPPPMMAIVSGDATICAGNSATIPVVLTGTGPWTLTWSDGFTQYNVTDNPATNTVSPASTTTYTVIAIADSTCTVGTSSGSALVTVNALPSVFNVTGGGWYCSGGTGVDVGLSGSQTGVNYQLRLNGSNMGLPVAGTGVAISFGLKTAAGGYTVIASNTTTSCSVAMTGSAIVTIKGLNQILGSVAAGLYDSYALQTNGTLWTWGWNSYGQLGDGTTADRWYPAEVTGVSSPTGGWAAVAGGYAHTVAADTNGTVWTWGNNDLGQLGDGTRASQSAPERLGGIFDVVAVAAGEYHTMALRSDGTV